MTREEFEILSAIATGEDSGIQQQNSVVLKQLKEAGYIENYEITEKGLQALEPYRVKRAIYMAAGVGSRMVPITINTPKPLVRVHGKRIIETSIEAVLAAGIEEIYIIRGYLGEQFELLQKKYPMIKLVENPEYMGTGTISSLNCVKNLLEGAYVMESDLVIRNPKVIHRYHYSSDYLGAKMPNTDDWFFKVDAEGRIQEIGINGSGDNLYKFIGISYWSPEDGKKLSRDIKEAYEGSEGKKLPMEFVPLRVYKDKYHVSIMPCGADDVVEIDTFEELQRACEKKSVKS